MDLREAEALVDELWRLMDSGPGENPASLRRISEICWNFRNAPRCDHALAETLADTRKMFELWFSSRAWKQWGADGEGARAVLGDDLRNVRRAAAACFGKAPGSGAGLERGGSSDRSAGA